MGAITELFPSFNAIEEIRISETINPAEYGGVADISTISKSGTNHFTAAYSRTFQNSDLNASNTFSNTTPTLKMNNFGGYIGGPVIFPKLYNGTNKTFFFVSLESLQLPRTLQYVESVPTVAMRNAAICPLSQRCQWRFRQPADRLPGNIIPPARSTPIR
jgi:hypothetical protein